MKDLIFLLGKLWCWITDHKKPYKVIQNRIWKVEYCDRCGKVITKEKIGRTFAEIWHDEYFNHGNQIW